MAVIHPSFHSVESAKLWKINTQADWVQRMTGKLKSTIAIIHHHLRSDDQPPLTTTQELKDTDLYLHDNTIRAGGKAKIVVFTYFTAGYPMIIKVNIFFFY